MFCSNHHIYYGVLRYILRAYLNTPKRNLSNFYHFVFNFKYVRLSVFVCYIVCCAGFFVNCVPRYLHIPRKETSKTN